jgi:hypothetical protein
MLTRKPLLYYLAGLLSVAAVACTSHRIAERTLVKLLADMHLADATMERQASTPRHMQRRDSTTVYHPLLEKYGCTEAQLHRSLAAYGTHKDKADKLYSKVAARLLHMQAEAQRSVELLHRQQRLDSLAHPHSEAPDSLHDGS